MNDKKEIGVGLIGCGVVGGGVIKHLTENATVLEERLGAGIAVRKVAVRDLTKDRGLDPTLLTDQPSEVIDDPSVDIVVELMGGTDQAYDLAQAALQAGKPLVTANKALLAERGESLFAQAEESGVSIFFEASIAGGIPIVKALSEGLSANRILSIHGIINGTCNYILSRMSNEGLEFEPILKEAKELGYAEADESLDVDGIDAAHKAALLGTLAFGFWVPMEDVLVEGIREITAADILFARKLGYRIILLATMKPIEGSAVEVRVHPTLIPEDHILASVTGVFNAVTVTGDVVGHTLYYGRGAGADPTASAVISDVIEAGQGILNEAAPRKLRRHQAHGQVIDRDQVVTPFYARLLVENRPGVLAQVARILGEKKIGISSVFQPEEHEEEAIPLVMLLDRAKEADLRSAIAEVEQLDVVKGPCQIIRVEDFS
ncbi:MAG: homoserine dehydrogenase [Verrucomicrobiota bacterium]